MAGWKTFIHSERNDVASTLIHGLIQRNYKSILEDLNLFLCSIPSSLTDIELPVLCRLPSKANMTDPSMLNNTMDSSNQAPGKVKALSALRRFLHKAKIISTLRKFPPKVKALPALTTLPPKVKSRSTLRKLPPEIRMLIFECSMDLDCPLPATMSPLISALRPDQTLYHEALEVLRTKSCFSIEFKEIPTTSKSQLGYLRKLILRYEYLIPGRQTNVVTRNRESDSIDEIPEEFVQNATGLRELNIHFSKFDRIPLGLSHFAFTKTRINNMIERLSVTFPCWIRPDPLPAHLICYTFKACKFNTTYLYEWNADINVKETVVRGSPGHITRILSVRRGEKLLQKSFPVLVTELQELVELRDIKKIEDKLVEFRRQLAEFPKGSQLPK